MERLKDKLLIIGAYMCLAVSILSLFTTIIGYKNGNGEYKAFSVLDLVSSGEFEEFVGSEYTGTVYIAIQGTVLHIFVVVGIAAIFCVVIGLATLSSQKKNVWPFIMTLIGLIGTMVPSILILVFVLALNNNYIGTLSCGVYPIITPIAMIISIIASTQMFRRNRAYVKKLKAAEGLIFHGGNL